MKLTRKQLQTIIKEELEAAIEEGHGGMMEPKEMEPKEMKPKDVFFRVIIPALDRAGFKGYDAMKMARDAVDAAFGMGAQMMAPMLEEGSLEPDKYYLMDGRAVYEGPFDSEEEAEDAEKQASREGIFGLQIKSPESDKPKFTPAQIAAAKARAAKFGL